MDKNSIIRRIVARLGVFRRTWDFLGVGLSGKIVKIGTERLKPAWLSQSAKKWWENWLVRPNMRTLDYSTG